MYSVCSVSVPASRPFFLLRPIPFGVLFLLLAVLPAAAFAQDERLDKTVIDALATSVVQIVTFSDGEAIATGTGTIVDSSGLIFTNAHVVEGGDDFAILILEDQNELPVLRYYATAQTVFEELDFAILQINRSDSGSIVLPSSLDLPAVDVINTSTDEVARGDTVYIFGYPAIADGYFAQIQGTITTIQNGEIDGTRLPVWYQTDAEISPGNSGGLAVNSQGAPVGIPTAVNTESATGGRLGGILPFTTVLALIESGTTTVTGTPNTPQADEPDETDTTSSTAIGAADINLECDNGDAITNGTRVTVVQMRSGFTYRATVIGARDFDPVLMVVNPDGESGFCNDDASVASTYAVQLGDLGTIEGNARAAQVEFSQSSASLADMQLVVGGYQGMAGTFALILEGMAVTPADGLGDPFSVLLTQSVIDSGNSLAVFMIGAESQLDPFISTIENGEGITDTEGYPIECDDAGDLDLCWGESIDLTDFYLARGNRVTQGDSRDPMLVLDPAQAADAGYESMTFYMSSYEGSSTGNYIVVFLISID